MYKNLFNGIVILDAIPQGEMNTARRLKESLKDISCNSTNGRLQVDYFRIETMDDLKNGISKVLNKIKNNGLKPWLHLEGHGLSDQAGFRLAGGTDCSWVQFKGLITPINVRAEFNLFLILATCYGGCFTRAIRTTDRAPVLGLIGPQAEIKVREIKDGFPAFYQTLFESALLDRSVSLSKAITALNKTTQKSRYHLIFSDDFFYAVWTNYKKQFCTRVKIKERARGIFQRAKPKELYGLPRINRIKRDILSKKTQREFFKISRNHYFMYDIYDNNRYRFPVTYEEAESRVPRLTRLSIKIRWLMACVGCLGRVRWDEGY